jgi:hypothetical protein
MCLETFVCTLRAMFIYFSEKENGRDSKIGSPSAPRVRSDSPSFLLSPPSLAIEDEVKHAKNSQ